MSIGVIKEFDLGGGSWRSYIDRLRMYFKANNIKEELQLPTLIAVVGDQTYELLVNLASPKNPSDLKFDELVQLVGEHLQPKPSVMAERYKFRLRRQDMGESVAQYVAELKRLSRQCEFKDTLNDNLRDQLVCGIASDVIRQRLFAEADLSYSKAVTLAMALEAAERDAAVVEKKQGISAHLEGDLHGLNINKHVVNYKSMKNKQDGGNCPVCGRYGHRQTECRYKKFACNMCKEVGHLQRACPRRQQVAANMQWRRRSHGPTGRGQSTHFAAEITSMDKEDSRVQSTAGSDEEESIHQMSLRNYPAVSILISIEGKPIHMEIDSGSPCSCISEDMYFKYFNTMPLLDCSLTLSYYTGNTVKPIGYITPNVKHGEICKKLDLYVFNNGKVPLIGRQWLAELKIQIPLFNVHNISEKASILCTDKDVASLVDRYSELFDGSLGKYTGGRAALHVREGATPVFCRARPVPYALRERVDKELDRMLHNGTIEPVEISEWATPLVLVNKPDGKLRVCADFKVTLNPVLLVDKFPLPRIEDLLSNLSGGEQFSKIDLSHAYNQIVLDERSRVYTVINTHRGLFKYNRLVYGLSSSAGIFSRITTNLLSDIPGVSVFCDDVLVTSSTRQGHIEVLNEVFRRLKDHGLKVNRNKCVFFSSSVNYLGHIIDKQGIRTDPAKIRAIVELPKPTNVTELRSFIGMVNFYGKFIRNLSTHMGPLFKLLKKTSKWVWDHSCDVSFKKIKQFLTSTEVLAHYRVDKPLIVTCDASARGIGAVLSVVDNEGERPVCYASRTLAEAEKQYSQIQREALAIVFATKKFHQYIYGRKFLLRTDHKPLIAIFGPKSGIPTMAASRLQRWAVTLSGYDFDMEYVKTDNNAADALSRLPINDHLVHDLPEQTYLHFARDALLLDHRELRSETQRDPMLGRIFGYIRDGWPNQLDIKQLQPYFNRKNELYIESDCVMWGHRVVVPQKHQRHVLNELHETHLGMVKMKSLARSYVWWPGLDEAIEAQCRACGTCATHAAAPPAHTPCPWPWLGRPWRRLHLDFLGPIAGNTYLVIVDSTTKWIEAFRMVSTTATEVVKKLRQLFSQFGLPTVVVSDNGPPFASAEFKSFLSSNGISQAFSAPYHPSSNGAAENAVKICKRVIKKAISDKVDVESALQRFLLLYRNTEHATTGESPAMALQGRTLRTRLDALKPDRDNSVRMLKSQERYKYGSHRELQQGEQVYSKDYGKRGEWVSGQIVDRMGNTNYKVRSSDGRESHRHVDQLKRRSSCAPNNFPADSSEHQGSGLLPVDYIPTEVQHESDVSSEPIEHDIAAPDTINNETNGCSSGPVTASPRARPPSPVHARPKRIRFPVKRYGFEFN